VVVVQTSSATTDYFLQFLLLIQEISGRHGLSALLPAKACEWRKPGYITGRLTDRPLKPTRGQSLWGLVNW